MFFNSISTCRFFYFYKCFHCFNLLSKIGCKQIQLLCIDISINSIVKRFISEVSTTLFLRFFFSVFPSQKKIIYWMSVLINLYKHPKATRINSFPFLPDFLVQFVGDMWWNFLSFKTLNNFLPHPTLKQLLHILLKSH